jgi:hypothetical protein
MQTKLTIECDIADAQAILYEAAKIIDKRVEIDRGNADRTVYKLKCWHCGRSRNQRLNTDCGGCGRTLGVNHVINLGDMPFRAGLTEDKEGSGHANETNN